MIEGIAILAIGAVILLYAEKQSNKKTIEELSYKIRHLTGNMNEDDKRKNIIEERAEAKFKSLYGYEYRKK